ncbi:MAG TPA: hypothetical protein VME22_06940 [Solirubrobacteraceae bacterium]|nr:hypothetical protein [Solirubrobacteraceae bacterium]
MAVLELHRGGRDPEVVAELEEEAVRALRALADAMPRTDEWREPVDLLAAGLGLRVEEWKSQARMQEFHARRAARKARLIDEIGPRLAARLGYEVD